MLQRFEIVNGVVEVGGVTSEATMDHEDKETEGVCLFGKYRIFLVLPNSFLYESDVIV